MVIFCGCVLKGQRTQIRSAPTAAASGKNLHVGPR